MFSFKESLRFNSASAFLTLLFTMSFSLISKIVISRLLQPNEFGLFIQIQTVFTMLVFFLSLSLPESVVILTSRKNASAINIVRTSLKLSFFFTLFALAITIFLFIFNLRFSFLGDFTIEFLALIFLFAFLKVITDNFGAVTQGHQMLYKKNAINEIYPNSIYLAVLLIFFGLHYYLNIEIDYKFVIFSYLILYSIPFIFYAAPINIKSLLFSKSSKENNIKEMWSFAWPLQLSGILAWPLGMMPLFIGNLAGNEVVAVYSLSISLASLIYISTSAIDAAGFSSWANQIERKEMSTIRESFRRYVYFSALVSSPILCILIINPSEIVNILFGERYLEIARVLPFFSATLFLNLIGGPMEGLLKAGGYSRVLLIARTGSGASAAVLFYPLIKSFGLFGAFLVFFCSTILGKSIYIIFGYKKFGVNPISKSLVSFLGLIFLSLGLVLYLKDLFTPMHDVLVIFCSLISFVIFIWIISFATNIRPINDLNRLLRNLLIKD